MEGSYGKVSASFGIYLICVLVLFFVLFELLEKRFHKTNAVNEEKHVARCVTRNCSFLYVKANAAYVRRKFQNGK